MIKNNGTLPWSGVEHGAAEYYITAFEKASDGTYPQFVSMLDNTLASLIAHHKDITPVEQDGLTLFFFRILGGMYETLVSSTVMNFSDSEADNFTECATKVQQIVTLLQPDFPSIPLNLFKPEAEPSIVDLALLSLTSNGSDVVEGLSDGNQGEIERVYENAVELSDEERARFITGVQFLYALADLCYMEVEEDMPEDLQAYLEAEQERLGLLEEILEAYIQ